ncbi:MAG: hypothetical protein IT405_01400 [Candidatus Yanofskybacteria bacterium]|nr:hypothetical protein [Candidatus Yanofskybacteria bacterium]
MRRFRFISAILIALCVASAMIPQAAHAENGTSGIAGLVGNLIGINVLDLVERSLTLVKDIIVTTMNWLGQLIQQALALPLTTGGPAVYSVWKLLRDMCNLLFIVAFIVMSFATIFGIFLKGDYYYSNAIKGVLIAAISINFSLAIGQTVIWVGNEASKKVIELMPSGISGSITAALQLDRRITGDTTPSIDAVPGADTPEEFLTERERVAVAAWKREGYAKALTVFRDCLEHNESQHACFLKVSLSSTLKEDIIAAASRPRGASQEVDESFWESFLSGSYGKKLWAYAATRSATQNETVLDQAAKIGSLLLTILILLVVVLSYLTIIVFMVIRLPAMWLLLSVSSLAFFTYAVPGKSMLKNWFNGVLAWSIFSPLYLFIIYLGLYMFSQRSTLLATVLASGGSASFASGFIASALYLLIIAAIFIGGAGWALKFSFSLGKGAGQLSVGTWFGATAGKWFGISEKTPYATRIPGAAALGRISGITPAYKAGRERVQQFGSDVVAGARGRLPSLLKTEEEALALRRRQFGVRGGAEGVAKVTGDAIRKEQDILSAAIKAREAEAAARGKTFDETAFLREKAGSGNRQIAFAAKEILTTKGKLDAASMKQTAEEYAGISAIARQSYLERVSKQLSEKAEKKEYKDAADVLSSLDILTKPQQDKLLKSLERNQPLIAAALADKFYTRPDGSKARASDILERNARAISNSDWAKILEEAKAGNVTLTKPLEEILTERTKKLTDYLEMVRTAKPDQQVEIAHIAALAENLRRQKGNRKQSKKQR